MRHAAAFNALAIAIAASGGSAFAAEPVPAARSDQLLLLAVDFQHETFSEALPAYGDPADPMLPVSELARLLGLDIIVLPGQGRITGRLGQAQRPLTIDLKSGEARSGSVGLAIGEGDLRATPTEIYVRASLLQQLLPLDFKVDADNLSVSLVPREKLPFLASRERASRLLQLSDEPLVENATLKVPSPYRMVSVPTFDLAADIGGDSSRGGLLTRFEGRVAADVLRTNVTGFLGTDDRGKLSSIRVKAERRSLTGGLLGPLHATYAAAGDVFSPALSVGPRSVGGAGVIVSNAPLQEASVFERVDLRGELPLGYDVELYVNDVLRAGQHMATKGRYEFLDVGLVRGVNVVRLVAYGPRGERDEETRVINVGGGVVAKGATVIEAGIVWQDKPMIDATVDEMFDSYLAKGKARAVVSVAHGLTSMLTLQAGGAIFSDQLGQERRVVSGGLRTSLAGLAVQFDHARDLNKGSATSLAAAGRIVGISVVGRHAEYTGRFVDENVPYFDVSRVLSRYSDLTFDMTVPFLSHTRLPISGRVERAQFADGGTTFVVRARTTLSAADTLFAIGGDYSRRTVAGQVDTQASGSIAATRLVDYKWQLRASTDFDFTPRARLSAMTLTADRALSERYSLRLGLSKSFGPTRDLTAQGGVSARLPFGQASLIGDYSTSQKSWRVGLQINVGLAWDPNRRGYRLTPPGPASGGSVAFQAFHDNNGNGLPDRGEDPLAGIAIDGPGGRFKTDAKGQALVTGLGDAPTGLLRIDASEVDTVFGSAPPSQVAFSPRPGDVLKVLYPIVPTSEVATTIKLRQSDGSLIGLAAVYLKLVPERGEAITASTEFDGMAVFEQVRPGRYKIELEQEQARRLGMFLVKPLTVEVGAKGAILRVAGEVGFEVRTK